MKSPGYVNRVKSDPPFGSVGCVARVVFVRAGPKLNDVEYESESQSAGRKNVIGSIFRKTNDSIQRLKKQNDVALASARDTSISFVCVVRVCAQRRMSWAGLGRAGPGTMRTILSGLFAFSFAIHIFWYYLYNSYQFILLLSLDCATFLQFTNPRAGPAQPSRAQQSTC